jgi:hypothetical protein
VVAVALSLMILWAFSLWFLLIERYSLRKLFFLEPLMVTNGTVLFFILTLASLLFIRLLFKD